MRQNERHMITLTKEGNSISVTYLRATCVCGWKSDQPAIEEEAREKGWAHLTEVKERVELGTTQASLTKKMIYLASPHTHTLSGVRQDRYQAALECLDWLLVHGFWAFSPIVHSHNLPSNIGDRITWEAWAEFDTETITRMDELWVLIMPGTKESKGVRAEIKIAELQGKKIIAIWKTGSEYTIAPFAYALLDEGRT